MDRGQQAAVLVVTRASQSKIKNGRVKKLRKLDMFPFGHYDYDDFSCFAKVVTVTLAL